MKEFQGKLQNTKPENIIRKDKSNDLDNFFLVLGLIFNDFKDLILFKEIFEENYRLPEVNKVSYHMGEYGGVRIHIDRLFISLVNEFLIFIKNNKKTINSIQFTVLIKKLNREDLDKWHKMYLTAIGEYFNESDFLSKIAKIRSNIISHYDESGTQVRRGFVRKFFETPKNAGNEFAYYSLGTQVGNTRFHYCDGALEEYLKENLIIFEENHREKIRQITKDMVHVIYSLFTKYFEYKKI
jgi:hypothetical protein